MSTVDDPDVASLFLYLAESEEEEETDSQQGGTKKRKAKKGTQCTLSSRLICVLPIIPWLR